MVLRILDKSKLLVDLQGSGLIGRNLEKKHDLLAKPYGVILVTGPPDSVKTTTLYGFLAKLNSPTRNIKIIKDPVE